jgi:hypothetical protein
MQAIEGGCLERDGRREMPTERELAGKQANAEAGTSSDLDIRQARPALDAPRATESIDRNIRPLYEGAFSAPGMEKPGDVAAAEKQAALRPVAYFAARCLGRILGNLGPKRAIAQADAGEARRVVTKVLIHAVAVCAEGSEHADRQLAADVAAFMIPMGLMRRNLEERSALTEVLQGAGALGDCLKAVYRGHPEDCRRGAVDAALHTLKAVVLISGSPFESSKEAKSLHAEQRRDLDTLVRFGEAARFDLMETGPFGPLWQAEAAGFLAEGKFAFQEEILAELTPPMLDRSSVLVSAEFSHAPADVYAELQMPEVRGQRTEKSEVEAAVQKRLTESVLADLRALGASGLRLREQMIAPIQERLDALAGKSFGSYEANQRVVDELNAIIEAFGIRLLYAGPKKEYRDRVVVLSMYDRSDAAAGQFFVRLAEAGAKKISAKNEFPVLKAAIARSSNPPT